MLEAVICLLWAVTCFTFAYRGRGFYVPISTLFGTSPSDAPPMSKRLRIFYAVVGTLQLTLAVLAIVRR